MPGLREKSDITEAQRVEQPDIDRPRFDLSGTDGSAGGSRRRDQAWSSLTDASFTPPAGYRVVEVDTKSSARVRDLASLRRDLELATVFAQAFIDRGASRPPSERFADDALWMSALVMYGRAFGSSVRNSERLSDECFDDNERVTHRFLLDLRDKYVAHAVNNYEHTVVLAYLTDSAFESRKVSRVGQMHVELIPLDAEQLESLIDLCDKQISLINRRLVKAHIEVSAELEDLGLDRVYALPDLTPPEIDPSRVAKRRK